MKRKRTRLAAELRRAFTQGGWTLDEVARQVNRSAPTVHAYLHGNLEPPGLVLLKLVGVLDVPVRPLVRLAA